MRTSIQALPAQRPKQAGGHQAHDHAWRRMDVVEREHLLIGEYRCDLCRVVWAL